jgi:cytochrome c oxidase subunit II
MNSTYKQCFKIAFFAVILLVTVFSINQSVDFSGLKMDQLTAEKPLFGADEFQYEAPPANPEENALSSKVNWALLIFSILLVLVIANTLDISKYIARITGRETTNQNQVNRWIMLIFMIVGLAAVIWEYKVHGKLILLNNSASVHGTAYDSMFSITLLLTSIVFFATQFLLFWFAFSYSYKEGNKALYYAHNNKLEVFWTIIPSIVLTILVLRGHQTWKSVVYAEESYTGKIHKIEVFAYQFGWKARYAGDDGILGNADYKFISGKNELGLAYGPEVDLLLTELQEKIVQDEANIKNVDKTLASLMNDYNAANDLKDYVAMESVQKQIDDVKSGSYVDELKASIKRKTKQIERIKAIKENPAIFASTFTSAAEDDIITQEIHLAKDSIVTFNFRSKDIIHSAWLPHFRAQMNVVPGMPTKFTFVPNKSTAEAKKEFGEDFEYYLYCNKICGSSHYNMKLKVVVESQKEVNDWLKTQQPAFKKAEVVPAINTEAPANPTDTIQKMVFN